MKIDTTNAHEIEVHEWWTEASQLGIAPGAAYPDALNTTLGNGQPFVFRGFDAHGTALYMQAFGCITLKVLND